METVLLYFALVHNGDWEAIYRSISNLEKVDKERCDALMADFKTPYVTLLDPRYPKELKYIDKPPFVLFYQGNWELMAKPKVVVVGSRRRSPYGREMARRMAGDLAEKDHVVVSGLALGIDADAHEAAGGLTIAVLPCGIDTTYPSENIALRERIIERGGLVVSEYPGEVAAHRNCFVVRNRIVAGLGAGLVVVEAGLRSGTSLTVNYAIAFGRDVFVIPHRAGQSPGTNSLIKSGAPMVETADEVIDNLNQNFE